MAKSKPKSARDAAASSLISDEIRKKIEDLYAAGNIFAKASSSQQFDSFEWEQPPDSVADADLDPIQLDRRVRQKKRGKLLMGLTVHAMNTDAVRVTGTITVPYEFDIE